MNLIKRKKTAAHDAFVPPSVTRVCPRCQWFVESDVTNCAWCGTDLILYADIYGARRIEWTRRLFIFALWCGGGYIFFLRGAVGDIPWLAGLTAFGLWIFGLWCYLREARRLVRVALRYWPAAAAALRTRFGWQVQTEYPQDEIARLYRKISEENEKAAAIEKAAVPDKSGAMAAAGSTALEIVRANLEVFYRRAHELEVLRWLNQIQRRKFEEPNDSSFEHRFTQIGVLEESGSILAELEAIESAETRLSRRSGLLLLEKMRTAAHRDNLSALLGTVSLTGEVELSDYRERLEPEYLRQSGGEEDYENEDSLEFEAARIESLGNLLANKNSSADRQDVRVE